MSLDALSILPAVRLAHLPSPVEELPRLRDALGGGPRLLIKRDDAIGFAFGGNKVRKLQLLAADAIRQGCDALVTSGSVQSNSCRVTAAVAARLGMRCVLVVNGAAAQPAGNALLNRLLGAEVRHVAAREERAAAVEEAAAELRKAGRRPYVIPLGASTPLGAASYALAIDELLRQIDPPDVIVHASSSGGTQAGLAAGCLLAGVRTRVIGVSADEPAEALAGGVARLVEGLLHLLQDDRHYDPALVTPEVTDDFVGEGYGVPTSASREALELTARTEAIFLDPTYTAKAMAGLVAMVRAGAFRASDTVLFWHTGGQPTVFA